MKTTSGKAQTTPKVRKRLHIGFGIVGFIVIVASAIISYVILIKADKSQKYASMWDENYGLTALPEGLSYNVTDGFNDGEYWCFQKDGTGVMFHQGAMPTEKTSEWLKRGREKVKKSKVDQVDEETLVAAKYDYLVRNGHFFEGEETIVLMLGSALFDTPDRFTEDERKAIHDQLAIVFYYCSKDPSERVVT